jgi:hypothetical protein
LVISRLQEVSEINIEKIKGNSSLELEHLIKQIQGSIKSIENFLDFYEKVNEIINIQQQANYPQHENKANVIEIKANYEFYKKFFCEIFNEIPSYPALIIQYNNKIFVDSVELFESYLEMSQNNFIIIPNFTNENYQFLNYGIEKAFFNLGYYLEVIFTHHPNLPLKLYSFKELTEINKTFKLLSGSFTLLILCRNTSYSIENDSLIIKESQEENNFKKKYCIIKEISKKHLLRYIVFFSDFLYDKKNSVFFSNNLVSVQEKLEDCGKPKAVAPNYIIDVVSGEYNLDLDISNTLKFFKETDDLDKEIIFNEEKLEKIENENLNIVERLLINLNDS